jgi:hypothetical protein
MSAHAEKPARPVEAAEAGTSPEVLAIKADIARTQAELAATIDLLQERLSPSRLARDVKQAAMDTLTLRVAGLRTSAASATAQTLTHVDRAQQVARRRLRQTPLPVLLIATGVAAALYFSYRRGRPGR